jgi:hypothetical protein
MFPVGFGFSNTGTIPERQYELERETDMMINLTPIEVQEEVCYICLYELMIAFTRLISLLLHFESRH